MKKQRQKTAEMYSQICKVLQYILLLALTIVQAGCSSFTPPVTENNADIYRQFYKKALDVKEESQKQEGRWDGEEKQEENQEDFLKTDWQEPDTGNLEIAPANVEVTEQKSEGYLDIKIGSLELSSIPPGWKLEKRVSGEGTAWYALVDVHSECTDEEIKGHMDGYEHEIVITPYAISRMPEMPLQLAAEMREHFTVPLLYGIKGAENTKEVKGCWLYGENREMEEKEYFLFSENESGGKELFHIREGGAGITAYNNEMEAFWKFMDKGLVWIDGGTCQADRYTPNRRPMESYFLLNKNKDNALLMVLQENQISIYRKDSYDTAVSTQKVEGLDMAWIGIADIDKDGYEDFLCRYWLLDPIYDITDTEKDDFEGYLWNEEGHVFTYVSGEQMLKQYGGIWEERLDKSDDHRGEMMVPEELSNYWSGYLLKSREEMMEAMALLVSDRELSMSEIKRIAAENPAIKKEMLRIASTYDGRGTWLKVDADNDGTEDIFLCEYLGGTLGIVYYFLFSGTEKGDYILTDQATEMKTEFAFINWQGKNYLIKTTWEFTKKEMNGISLECYEDGAYQGGVWLAVTEKEGRDTRNINILYDGDGGYSALASKAAKLAEEYISGEGMQAGTAEKENEDGEFDRICDINNDGITEAYHVSLWQTTNHYTVDRLSFRAEESELEELFFNTIYTDESGGIFRNMWVDETEYGNVTYVVFEEGLYDFRILGYLFSETDSRKLFQVDCHVQTEVAQKSLLKSGRHGFQ